MGKPELGRHRDCCAPAKSAFIAVIELPVGLKLGSPGAHTRFGRTAGGHTQYGGQSASNVAAISATSAASVTRAAIPRVPSSFGLASAGSAANSK